MLPYYQQAVKEVIHSLGSSEQGLSSQEVKKRIEKYGPNELGAKKKINFLKIFLNQFNDPLIWVLLLAIGISALIQHYVDAIVILAIVLFNAGFGFFQEFKAEKAIEHLKAMRQFRSQVLRNGKAIEIDTTELVPGDILLIHEGDKIPADARIIEAVELKVDEASLTGESHPVSKIVTALQGKKVVGDQTNMLFMGTVVVRGRAKAIVTSTAKETELGKIAKEIESITPEPTPLQRKLKEIGKWLTFIVLGISALVFILGAFRGFGVADMFLMAVSLAVAAIPEGLPAVVTITLALGLRKMLKRKALVRKLRSVETLGSVSVICSDKTGTLTKNEMTVTTIYANGKDYDVTGIGYKTEGKILFGKKDAGKEVSSLVLTATTCNDATEKLGDPTERALKVLAAKAKVKKVERKAEIPFSSDAKFMSVTGKDGVTYLKGAVEVILKKCSHIEEHGKRRKLTAKDKKEILEKNKELSSKALRVLAYANGKKEIAFLGLTGMIDPPRPEVKQAIKDCVQAGIRSVMITGDHKITAEAVAKQVGITGASIEGIALDSLSDKELRKLVKKTSIFARVNSLHKARIAKAFQANGHVIAMTGDGVNDAPALKQADVGVAMNIKGTEISKDVSDLILLDDNFASIVAAVREGRTIYSNIKKFVKFLLAANFGEIMLVTIPIMVGLPLPILPVQILWVNLVTDSFPALALGVDPADPKVMLEKPRNPKESFFTNIKTFMIFATLFCTLATIGLFLYYFVKYGDLDRARTITFTTLIMFELFLVFACRSRIVSVFKLKQNYYLYGAVALSFSLQLLLLYTPLAQYFSLVPLTLQEWMVIVPVASSGFIFFEVKKLLSKKVESSKS